MNAPPPQLSRLDASDALLDQQVAAVVYGYAITKGPGNLWAATRGAGDTARLVEAPPVSSDLGAAWGAATVALAAGHADGFQVGATQQEQGKALYEATFVRTLAGKTTAICGATADSAPRAICGALLALYDGYRQGRRINARAARTLQ